MTPESKSHPPADASHPPEEPVPSEQLPPVTPPTAGFIIQLFLIPALIVVAIIGVWALFGKIAASDANWEQLVSELGSTNTHRRWRAANHLSQLLHNEQLTDAPESERLSTRREVALALTTLFRTSLESHSTQTDDINHQEFLARTMGALDVDGLVLPVLAECLDPKHETAVRKTGLMSVVMIAGRHFAKATGQLMTPDRSSGLPELTPLAEAAGLPLKQPCIQNERVLEQLATAAQDPDASLRHLAAYALGLVSGPDSMEQLHVMLLDSDISTQANAAIALARNADPVGIPVMIKLLKQGANRMSQANFAKFSAKEQQAELARRSFEEPAVLTNCITAVGRLWPAIPENQQAELKQLLQKLAGEHKLAGVRLQAKSLLREIAH